MLRYPTFTMRIFTAGGEPLVTLDDLQHARSRVLRLNVPLGQSATVHNARTGPSWFSSSASFSGSSAAGRDPLMCTMSSSGDAQISYDAHYNTAPIPFQRDDIRVDRRPNATSSTETGSFLPTASTGSLESFPGRESSRCRFRSSLVRRFMRHVNRVVWRVLKLLQRIGRVVTN